MKHRHIEFKDAYNSRSELQVLRKSSELKVVQSCSKSNALKYATEKNKQTISPVNKSKAKQKKISLKAFPHWAGPKLAFRQEKRP